MNEVTRSITLSMVAVTSMRRSSFCPFHATDKQVFFPAPKVAATVSHPDRACIAGMFDTMILCWRYILSRCQRYSDDVLVIPWRWQNKMNLHHRNWRYQQIKKANWRDRCHPLTCWAIMLSTSSRDDGWSIHSDFWPLCTWIGTKPSPVLTRSWDWVKRCRNTSCIGICFPSSWDPLSGSWWRQCCRSE